MSSGFPPNYPSYRRLELNKSIAGRALRTKTTQNTKNVKDDVDWKVNENSKNHYKSLICVPIGDSGVLTIDGREEMSDESVQIAELYSSVLEGALNEYYTALSMLHSQLDVESEEETG